MRKSPNLHHHQRARKVAGVRRMQQQGEEEVAVANILTSKQLPVSNVNPLMERKTKSLPSCQKSTEEITQHESNLSSNDFHLNSQFFFLVWTS